MTSFLGLNLAICLASSDPMLPAPPVTNIVFPSISPFILPSFITTCSLPSKSSIFTYFLFYLTMARLQGFFLLKEAFLLQH